MSRALVAAFVAWAFLASGGSLRADASALGIDPAALTVGERGVVRTVIQGSEIVEIPVRYVGYYENFAGPGHALYIVELEGEIGEHIGVAAGMSGSPVYFQDRLIGALSYSIGFFPKDAIAGITPIEDMLSAQRSTAGKSAVQRTGVEDKRRPRQIETPVTVAGIHEEVRDWLAERLRQQGLRLVAGGGGSVRVSGNSALAAPAPLVPGSPVGVGMMTGDMDISATGTVTWVDGDDVYAFGHPFLGRGRTEMPMLEASVLHTLADQSGSFRMTETGRPIGAVQDDRLTAVVGSTAARAAMFPMTVQISGAAYKDHTYKFDIVRNHTLAPILAAAGVANSVAANLGFDRRTGVLARGVVRFAEQPDLPFETAASGGVGVSAPNAVANHLQRLLDPIMRNRFAPVRIESIDVELEMIDGERLYTVRSLHYDRGPLRPGDNLAVRCVLESYRGETISHRFEIPIPVGLPRDARLIVAVGPPDQIDIALGRPTARKVETASSIEGLIEALAGLRSPHRLQAALYRVTGGVVADGETLEQLPPTALRLLSARSGSTGNRRGLTLPISIQEVEFEGPIGGGLQVRLTVDPDLETEGAPE